jgi:hypothetical protein
VVAVFTLTAAGDTQATPSRPVRIWVEVYSLSTRAVRPVVSEPGTLAPVPCASANSAALPVSLAMIRF